MSDDGAGPTVSGEDAVVFRQSTAKLVRALPVAGLMAGVSGAIFLVGVRGAGLVVTVAGALGSLLFGPALLVLLWALVRPSYLSVDADGLAFRIYSVEAAIPWRDISEIGAGAGWPSLTFHDPDRVAGGVVFRGLRPLGWIVEVPTRLVSLLVRHRLANLYPSTRRQLADGFRASAETFGFHYGLPTSLLDGSTGEIVAAMRRLERAARQADRSQGTDAQE